MPVYRFIFCVLNQVVRGYDDVVRHRCDNRLCINPDHLELGSRGENLQDERDFDANGVASTFSSRPFHWPQSTWFRVTRTTRLGHRMGHPSQYELHQ